MKEGEILADKYRVEKVLGVGGMGVVVAAMHIHLGKRVALKFMLPAALMSATAVERFAREARAAVRLKSEHVAQVLDVGTLASGSPYMVMEYLEGIDLGELLLERGAIPIDDAIEYVLQACEAIAEAHLVGIVHRDLKPRNVFLTTRSDGTALVKVLDFGISKLLAHRDGGEDDHALTRTADVMGSPYYMAPEQIRAARDADARTDIWGLGVILFELIAGRVPFLADSLPQLCGLVLTEPPTPLIKLCPSVREGLWVVIQKCLEKDPANRFQTVAELASALEGHASARGRVSVERVRAVRQSGPAGPQKPERTSMRVAVSGGTSVTWADTLLANKVVKKIMPTFALAALVLVLVGAGVVVARRVSSTGSTAVAASATAPEPSAREKPPAPSAVPIEPALAAIATDATTADAKAFAATPRTPTPGTATALASREPTHGARPPDAAAPNKPDARAEDPLAPGDRK